MGNKFLLNRSEIIKYLVELLIVMVGVFLGMLASQWNENRNQDNLMKESLANITSELQINENFLQNSIEYHKKISGIIDSIWRRNDRKNLYKSFLEGRGFNQIPNWNGIGMNVMQSSSYESAIINKAFVNMKPFLLESISKTYYNFSTYNSLKDRIANRLFSIDSGTKNIDVLLTITIIKDEVFNNEKYLLKLCEKTLTLIKKNK